MVDVMGRILDGQAALLEVCSPAEVVSFDRLQRTVSLRRVTLKADGSSYAPIPNAPVIFPGVRWDILAGEQGVIILADEDWRTWWRTGEDSIPEALASHEPANAFFIPGVTTSQNALTIPAGSKVVESTDLRLGDATATEPALQGTEIFDARGIVNTAFGIWLDLAAAAIIVGGGTDITVATTTMKTALATYKASIGTARSSKVKVSD